MAVTPQHDRQALAPMVVPDAARIRVAAVGMPNPIALYDLVDRVAVNDGFTYGWKIDWVAGLAEH